MANEKRTNIVQVNLFEDPSKKRYTYKLPLGITLKSGYIVKVRNANGRELPAVCITNSEELSENAVEMVMGGPEHKVTSSVVGIYSYMDFDLVAAISAIGSNVKQGKDGVDL